MSDRKCTTTFRADGSDGRTHLVLVWDDPREFTVFDLHADNSQPVIRIGPSQGQIVGTKIILTAPEFGE